MQATEILCKAVESATVDSLLVEAELLRLWIGRSPGALAADLLCTTEDSTIVDSLVVTSK